MIRFFRNIRSGLLKENKFNQYVLYAIGEISLVAIGILLALQVNNWNESRKVDKKEILILKDLRNDLKADIQRLTKEDSTYAVLESNIAKAINLFYKAKTTKDIEAVNKLNDDVWNVLYINDNTYLEMINSGSMYTMKNKTLQEKIIKHYLDVDADKSYISDVNDEQAFLYDSSPDLYPFKFLVNQLQEPKIDIKLIDTTWINNPNSTTYLAVVHYLNTKQRNSNTYRRSVYKRNIKRAKALLIDINAELNHKE